jgi:uncharacterized RDD family membrane protein YckC
MKCPKCGYLGFESVDRCRNCGYDFSLATAASPPDLTIRGDMGRVPARVPALDLSLAPAPDGAELPLFAPEDDRPLITAPSPPRRPLAVRRATPDVPRLRAVGPDQPRVQTLDWRSGADAAPAISRLENAGQIAPAAVGARFVAVLIDLLILAAIDAVVVYFTMQICGLTWAEVGILPKGPLLAFLLVQNGGYLVAFTAGGQTLGKMAAGIRVVASESAGGIDVGRAFARTLIWIVLAVPAGLGFLTLLGRDRRGLHDRFAGTRVVRSAA